MSHGAQRLSFSLKKSSVREPPSAGLQELNTVETERSSSREYITSVGRASPTKPDDTIEQRVIQSQPDSFKVRGKATFIPSFLPEPETTIRSAGSKEDRFEAEKTVKEEEEPVKYGLNLREPMGNQTGAVVKKEEQLPADIKLETGAKIVRDSQAVKEEQAYLEQVENLPDEAGPEVWDWC